MTMAGLTFFAPDPTRGGYVAEVEEIAYHRNGVSGIGFHVVVFTMTGNDGTYIATVFPEEGACAVLQLDLLADSTTIAFGENSWRGDVYEPELREAIKAWRD